MPRWRPPCCPWLPTAYGKLLGIVGSSSSIKTGRCLDSLWPEVPWGAVRRSFVRRNAGASLRCKWIYSVGVGGLLFLLCSSALFANEDLVAIGCLKDCGLQAYREGDRTGPLFKIHVGHV